MRVPYYFGDPNRDPNLENYPHEGIVELKDGRKHFRSLKLCQLLWVTQSHTTCPIAYHFIP